MPDKTPTDIPMTRVERASNRLLLAKRVIGKVLAPAGLEGYCWLLPVAGRDEQQKKRTHPAHKYRTRGRWKTVLDHRASYKMWHPKVNLDGVYLLHRCDRPACSNPEHLRVGTLEDNVRDREKWRRKLVPNRKGRLGPYAQARLRADWLTGRYTQQELALIGRVSRTTVRNYIEHWEAHFETMDESEG